MGFSSQDTQVYLWGMWGLPGPGIKSVSPALTDGFSTTELPGKSNIESYHCQFGRSVSKSIKQHCINHHLLCLFLWDLSIHACVN